VIVYEVDLRVQRDIAAAYRQWLVTHVDEMRALPGFEAAQMFSVPEADDAESVGYGVRYRLRDAAALDDYLRDHAPRMRADGVARFGDRFSATRRVLVPLTP
jgi:hypothetical protein